MFRRLPFDDRGQETLAPMLSVHRPKFFELSPLTLFLMLVKVRYATGHSSFIINSYSGSYKLRIHEYESFSLANKIQR